MKKICDQNFYCTKLLKIKYFRLLKFLRQIDFRIYTYIKNIFGRKKCTKIRRIILIKKSI